MHTKTDTQKLKLNNKFISKLKKTSVNYLKGKEQLDVGDRPEPLLAMTTEEFIWCAYFYVDVVILVNGSINGSTWTLNVHKPRLVWIWIVRVIASDSGCRKKWNDAAVMCITMKVIEQNRLGLDSPRCNWGNHPLPRMEPTHGGLLPTRHH